MIPLLSEALCFTTYLSPIYTEFSSSTFSSFRHLRFVLISVFGRENIPLVIFLSKQIFLLTSAFPKISKILIIFGDFCSPEFDSFMTDLAIPD